MANQSSPKTNGYWKDNKRLIMVLLAIWFVCGILLSIVLVDTPLMQFKLGKLSFGFWMAQQGAIYVFVLLIFVYAWGMDRLDKKHHLENGDE